MTHRSVSFAPTDLFKEHFPNDVKAQAKEFMRETWQERLQQKRELAASAAVTSHPAPTAVGAEHVAQSVNETATATCADVHPCQSKEDACDTYSEREMKALFFVGISFGFAAGVLFLWLSGGSK